MFKYDLVLLSAHLKVHIYIYIYLYIYMYIYISTPLVAHGFLIAKVPRSHSDTPQSAGFLQTVDRPVAEIST